MSIQIVINSANASFGAYLSDVLSEEGHRTSFIKDTKEAFFSIRSNNPDLIIIEVTAEDNASLELERKLQTMEITRHIPIIVISDCLYLEEELLTVFDFIPKPLDNERLLRNVTHLSRFIAKAPDKRQINPMTERDFLLFRDHLLTISGLHFDRNNRKNLERGLTKRMASLRIQNYQEYLSYLNRHGEQRHELQKLFQYLTVGETHFFRYQGHFNVIRKLINEQLSSRKLSKIRFWSAGCSTGEEPYSLAMTIMETLPDWRQRDIKIIATDINNQSLKKARDGVYRSWALRSMDQRYLDRYFDQIGQSFIIRDEVKTLVDYRHLNLSAADFQSECPELRELDAIFCRNVMIYFTPVTIRKIVEKFTASLKPGGHLFLGHSETLHNISTAFERVRDESSFFYQLKSHQMPKAPRPEQQPLRLVPQQQHTPPPRKQVENEAVSPEALYKQANLLFNAENYEAADRILELVLQQDPEHIGALIARGFILANNGRTTEALELCRRLQTMNDLLPEVYFLQGLLHDMNDQQTEAAAEYRKAILLDMNFVMPRHNLGRLYVRQGKKKEGARELRNSLKILSKGGDESLVPYSGGLSREVFMIQLQSTLAKIS